LLIFLRSRSPPSAGSVRRQEEGKAKGKRQKGKGWAMEDEYRRQKEV
jgi:hypothetical protein